MKPFILTGFADEIAEEFVTQLEGLKALNMTYIELRGANGKNIADHTLEEVRELKKQLDAYGINVSSIGSPIGKIFITDDFEPHLETFKHLLDVSVLLGSKYMRIFSFYIPKGEDPVQYRDEVIDRLKVLTHHAEERGIVLLHENEKEIYGDVAERCRELIDAIDSPSFQMAFDFANFIQCDVDPYAAYHLLEDAVVYFHIKDCVNETKQIVPAGYGDGRIKEILTLALEKGYEGFLSLEPHLGVFKGLQDLELDRDAFENSEESGFHTFKIAHDALSTLVKEILD